MINPVQCKTCVKSPHLDHYVCTECGTTYGIFEFPIDRQNKRRINFCSVCGSPAANETPNGGNEEARTQSCS